MTKLLLLPLLLATLGMAAKCSPDEPDPPEEINTYVGVYEKRSICRLEGRKEICIDTGTEEFNDYVCVSNDDYVEILDYISRLRTSCKEWKKRPKPSNHKDDQ